MLIGEIHSKSLPDEFDLEKDILFRTAITKKVIAEKMLEGVYKFEWNQDQVFHQVSDMGIEKLDRAKTVYTKQVNDYFDAFKKDLRTVKAESKKSIDATKREFYPKISKSAQEYKGKIKEEELTHRRIPQEDLYLEIFPELSEVGVDIQSVINTQVETLGKAQDKLVQINKYGIERVKNRVRAVENIEELGDFMGSHFLLFAFEREKILEGYRTRLLEDETVQELHAKDLLDREKILNESPELAKQKRKARAKKLESTKKKIEKLSPRTNKAKGDRRNESK